MKIQKLLFITFLFATVSIMTISCSDDPTVAVEEELNENESANDKIDGEWKIISLRIDGVETIGSRFQKATMEYDADKSSATGETTWEIVDEYGDTSIEKFSYEIKNDGEDITIDGDRLDLKVSSSSLDMEGNIDGYYWEIQADAK